MISPTKKQLNVFVFGLFLILLIFAQKARKDDNFTITIIFVGLTLFLLIIYLIKKDFVVQFYKIWMRCVSVIGVVITGILLVCVFYLLFVPVGIFLRLIGKDILNLGKDPKLESYWIDKPLQEFNKSDYERQF